MLLVHNFHSAMMSYTKSHIRGPSRKIPIVTRGRWKNWQCFSGVQSLLGRRTNRSKRELPRCVRRSVSSTISVHPIHPYPSNICIPLQVDPMSDNSQADVLDPSYRKYMSADIYLSYALHTILSCRWLSYLWCIVVHDTPRRRRVHKDVQSEHIHSLYDLLHHVTRPLITWWNLFVLHNSYSRLRPVSVIAPDKAMKTQCGNLHISTIWKHWNECFRSRIYVFLNCPWKDPKRCSFCTKVSFSRADIRRKVVHYAVLPMDVRTSYRHRHGDTYSWSDVVVGRSQSEWGPSRALGPNSRFQALIVLPGHVPNG